MNTTRDLKRQIIFPEGKTCQRCHCSPNLSVDFPVRIPAGCFVYTILTIETNTAETIWKTRITLEEPPAWADVMLTADGGEEDTQISGTEHFTWIWQVNVFKKYKNKSLRERRGYNYVSQMMESQFSTWCWNWQKKVNPEWNLTPCRKMDPMDHRPKGKLSNNAHF